MSRRSKYMTPIDREDDEIFGADDLDIADQIAGALPGPASGLGQKVALRDQKWADLVRVAPFARINPVSVLKGTLGGQQEVRPGENAQVALWGGDDAETTPVTITYAPVTPVDPTFVGEFNNGLLARSFGIVQFGTRGFLVNAEVDIGLGVQFTVGASMVSLQVALEPLIPGTFMGPFKLAGMLSFLPTQKVLPITRTRYVDSSDLAGTPQTVTVPMFARNLAVWRTVIADPITVLFNDAQTNAVYSYDMAAGQAGSMLIPVPLSGDVYSITVFRTGGGAYSSLRLIFGLCF